MNSDQPIEAGTYFWCACMGPKGNARISLPYTISVDASGCATFDNKQMGSFNLPDDVMWSRMGKSGREAHALGLALIERNDQASANRIRQREADAGSWQERNTPHIDESRLVPAWYAEEP